MSKRRKPSGKFDLGNIIAGIMRYKQIKLLSEKIKFTEGEALNIAGKKSRYSSFRFVKRSMCRTT